MSSLLTRPAVRTWTVALRLLVLAVAATIAVTAVVALIAQVAMPARANGSIVTAGGRPVGSALLAQGFTAADGSPLPQWFQPRPSAAGDGWDGGASSGSNLGPDSAVLRKAVEQRRADYLALNGPGSVPADAVTTSGSGLDPDVSVENARRQAGRVAAARGLPVAAVRRLIAEHTSRDPFEQPSVDVLALNLALAGR